jgi:hypothetical protein
LIEPIESATWQLMRSRSKTRWEQHTFRTCPARPYSGIFCAQVIEIKNLAGNAPISTCLSQIEGMLYRIPKPLWDYIHTVGFQTTGSTGVQ